MDAECMDEKLKNQFVQVSQCRITFFFSRWSLFSKFSRNLLVKKIKIKKRDMAD